VQIVGKLKKGQFGAVEKRVADCIRDAHRSRTDAVRVTPVFPNVATGSRAGLFTIDLPDDLPAPVLDAVMQSLRRDESVEYAELPAPKRPA
jgi:hypothetical protein